MTDSSDEANKISCKDLLKSSISELKSALTCNCLPKEAIVPMLAVGNFALTGAVSFAMFLSATQTKNSPDAFKDYSCNKSMQDSRRCI